MNFSGKFETQLQIFVQFNNLETITIFYKLDVEQIMHTPQEVQIVVTPANDYHGSSGSSRRNTGDRKELTDFFVSSRRQSLAVRRVSNPFGAQRRYMLE